MAITLSDECNVQCPHCQAVLLVVMWLAIDLMERADLRETLANGSTYVHACTACNRVFPRQTALVVTRMDDAAPVVMGCPKEALLAGDPERDATDLLDHVYEQVRGGDAVIPWPMLYIPFPVLKVAVERDIGHDIDHVEVALADVARDSPALAKLYAIFLDDSDASSVVRALNVGVERLHRVTSESELRELVAAFPGLLSVEAHELLAKLAQSLTREEERRVVHAELALLRAYRDGDTAGAWARYEEAFLATMDITFNPELQRLLDIFKDALDGDREQMITAGEQLIGYARHVRQREIETVACLQTAVALLETHDADRAARIEQAIRLLERANDLLDRHPDVGDQDLRRQTLAHLAAALGTRLRFDPAANQERAIAIQRRLLDQVTIDIDGDLWAKTHTHLANHLLARARALSDREGPVAELPEILDHLSEALRWRSFERDPLDWAHTELALGHARAEGGGDLDAAAAHYDRAVRGFEAAGEPVLRAQAIGRRASVRIDLAQAATTPGQRRAELLEVAETDARAQLHLLGTHLAASSTARPGGSWRECWPPRTRRPAKRQTRWAAPLSTGGPTVLHGSVRWPREHSPRSRAAAATRR